MELLYWRVVCQETHAFGRRDVHHLGCLPLQHTQQHAFWQYARQTVFGVYIDVVADDSVQPVSKLIGSFDSDIAVADTDNVAGGK
ncbi:hypothetical protein D3C84_612000 [compost metagenome]